MLAIRTVVIICTFYMVCNISAAMSPVLANVQNKKYSSHKSLRTPFGISSSFFFLLCFCTAIVCFIDFLAYSPVSPSSFFFILIPANVFTSAPSAIEHFIFLELLSTLYVEYTHTQPLYILLLTYDVVGGGGAAAKGKTLHTLIPCAVNISHFAILFKTAPKTNGFFNVIWTFNA